MAERNFVDLGGGRYRRHPARLLFEAGFADGGDVDILRMYRRLAGPALLVQCTRSPAPDVLDHELDALVASNHHVEVVRLPITHLAPAWDALEPCSPSPAPDPDPLRRRPAETHHRVCRITDDSDDDWTSWYANGLLDLSELPDLLRRRPNLVDVAVTGGRVICAYTAL